MSSTSMIGIYWPAACYRRGMRRSDRRTFLKTAASTVALRRVASAQAQAAVPPEQFVSLGGDGVYLPPLPYAQLLASITGAGTGEDGYLKGGVVEELEGRFARLLGK